MARGLPQAPRWAWITIVVGLLVMGSLLAFGRHPAADPVTPAQAARMQAGLAAARASASAAARSVVVYGDSYTGGTGLGGVGAKNWTVLAGKKLGVRVAADAAGGGGYVQVSPFTHGTFTNLIADAPPTNANVVVIFGSRNDATFAPAAIGRAAAADYAAIKKADPTAKLIVIGPCWSDQEPPAGAFAARDAVKVAALAARATFVDPLADGWFRGRSDLIGSDGVHPTDAGHAYLADKISPLVQAALAQTG